MNNQALVVRILPERSCILLFDKASGIMPAYTRRTLHHHVVHGAHITYVLKKEKPPVLDRIELIGAPLELAVHDIAFLHHLLELCQHFIHYDSNNTAIFDMICTVLHSTHIPFNDEQKLLILIKFFLHIGIYDYCPLSEDMINQILNMPVNNLFLVKILDEKRIKMVQSWLLHCRTLHPHNHLFKTE